MEQQFTCVRYTCRGPLKIEFTTTVAQLDFQRLNTQRIDTIDDSAQRINIIIIIFHASALRTRRLDIQLQRRK